MWDTLTNQSKYNLEQNSLQKKFAEVSAETKTLFRSFKKTKKPNKNNKIKFHPIMESLQETKEELLKEESMDTVKDVIDCMNQFPEKADIQSKCSWILIRMSIKTQENKDQIQKLCGIEAILRSMRNHPSNAKIQEQGCWNLRIQAYRNPKNVEDILNLDGLHTIVQAMCSHCFVSEVQEQGAYALLSLCNDTQRLKALKDADKVIEDMVKQVIYIMGVFQDDCLQEYCCMLLLKLATDKKTAGFIIQEKGIESIVRILNVFPGHRTIQENGCGALCVLFSWIGSIKNKEDLESIHRIAEKEEIIRVVVKSLRSYRSSWAADCESSGSAESSVSAGSSGSAVLPYSCVKLLHTLLQNNPRYQDKFIRLRALDDLFEILMMHTKDETIQKLCLSIMMGLALNSFVDRLIMEKIVHYLVFPGLLDSSQDLDFQEMSLIIFMLFVKDSNKKNQDIFMQWGGYRLVLKYMQDHSDNQNIQEQGCCILGTLGFQNYTRQCQILEAGGFDILKNAALHFQGVASIQLFCSQLLLQMSRIRLEQTNKK